MAEKDSSNFITAISRISDLDTAHAIEILGGSDVLYEKTVLQMVRFIPSSVEQMDHFLADPLTINDFAVKVHGIKSSLRQLGHHRMAKSAEALEKAAKAEDRVFCLSHYDTFKEALLHFYAQANAVILSCAGAEAAETSENTGADSASDFCEILARVRLAAEDYDAIAASEHLLPLTKRRYGEAKDNLIKKIMEALDTYQTRQALEYIAELLTM